MISYSRLLLGEAATGEFNMIGTNLTGGLQNWLKRYCSSDDTVHISSNKLSLFISSSKVAPKLNEFLSLNWAVIKSCVSTIQRALPVNFLLLIRSAQCT